MAEQNPNGGGGKADYRFLRCQHCAGPLTKEMETSKWTVLPLVRDSFSLIGSAVGGVASALYGFNRRELCDEEKLTVTFLLTVTTMPIVRRRIRGPMWLHFFVGTPPVIIFSSGCAGLAGGSIPALAQLASSSCHAFVSSSPTPPSSP